MTSEILLVAVGRLRHRVDLELLHSTWKGFEHQTIPATHMAAVSLQSESPPTSSHIKKMRRIVTPWNFKVVKTEHSIILATLEVANDLNLHGSCWVLPVFAGEIHPRVVERLKSEIPTLGQKGGIGFRRVARRTENGSTEQTHTIGEVGAFAFTCAALRAFACQTMTTVLDGTCAHLAFESWLSHDEHGMRLLDYAHEEEPALIRAAKNPVSIGVVIARKDDRELARATLDEIYTSDKRVMMDFETGIERLALVCASLRFNFECVCGIHYAEEIRARLFENDCELIFTCPHIGLIRSIYEVNRAIQRIHPAFAPLVSSVIVLRHLDELGANGVEDGFLQRMALHHPELARIVVPARLARQALAKRRECAAR